MVATQANVPHMRIIWFASYVYHMNQAPYDNHMIHFTYDKLHDYHMITTSFSQKYDYHMFSSQN